MNWKITILLCLFYVSSLERSLAQQIIELNNPHSKINLLDNLLILEDKKRSFKEEDILHGKYDSLFKKPTSLNLGFNNSNFWIKFKLKNRAPNIKNRIGTSSNIWFLQSFYPHLDTVILYHRNLTGVIDKSMGGDRIPLKDHSYAYSTVTFPIELQDSSTNVFYLKVNTLSIATISLNLKNVYEFEQSEFFSQLFYGLFFGSLTIMLLYNLFIWSASSQVKYLYYCFYILSYEVAQLSNTGQGYYLFWGEYVQFANYVFPFSTHVGILSIILFAFDFLEIKKVFPKLYYFYRPILLCCGLFLVGSLYLPSKILGLLTIFWIFSTTTFLFVLGILVWIKGKRYAKYYVIGWITFLLGLSLGNIIRSLEILGLLNNTDLGFVAHSFLFRNLHQVGSMIEVLFFSIALADQINILRQEKEQAEAEKFRITKENEKILEQQNKMLDEMVQKRTKDLENIQAELLSQNEYISQKNMAVEKQALALEDLNKSKDKIFSIVAHDLRGPLSSVQGMFKLLETREISEKDFFEFLPSMTRKVNSAFDLTEEVLYWARNQMNAVEVIPVPISVKELFEEKVLRFKEQTMEKGLHLETELRDESLQVYADMDMVKTILRNLISNAIKFCKKDAHIILRADKKGDYVELKVSDTGVGISEENITKLFTSRTFTTYGTANEKGTGLGLTLCKELVEKNGGTIGVSSIIGQGSDFYFTLPVQ